MPSDLGNARSRRDDRAVIKRSGARLANRLAACRAARGLSQTDLAHATGVSRQTISSIETGQYGPSALLAFRVAAVLDHRVDEVFWIEGGTS